MCAKGADSGPIYQSAGTKRMAERLRAAFAATDWKLDPSKPLLRVAYYSAVLSKGKLSLEQDTIVREQLAREMLGDSDGSIRQLEEVRRRWLRAEQTMPPYGVKELGKDLAISYLRLGEQENCATMHGQRACLFPLRAGAVHQMPCGAEGAVRELTALLEQDSADTQSRWLLNVAYMQLGRYPKDVPPRWLILASHFDSEAKLPEFPEIAASAGIDITGHAGGVVVEDFDSDGLLDVMVSSSGPLDQMQLFHNNHDGTFTEIGAASGLADLGFVKGVAWGDYNNDGRPDLYVSVMNGKNRLFRNDGRAICTTSPRAGGSPM